MANSPSHGAMYAMLARLWSPFLMSSWTIAAERAEARMMAPILSADRGIVTSLVGSLTFPFCPYFAVKREPLCVV